MAVKGKRLQIYLCLSLELDEELDEELDLESLCALLLPAEVLAGGETLWTAAAPESPPPRVGADTEDAEWLLLMGGELIDGTDDEGRLRDTLGLLGLRVE